MGAMDSRITNVRANGAVRSFDPKPGRTQEMFTAPPRQKDEGMPSCGVTACIECI